MNRRETPTELGETLIWQEGNTKGEEGKTNRDERNTKSEEGNTNE